MSEDSSSCMFRGFRLPLQSSSFDPLIPLVPQASQGLVLEEVSVYDAFDYLGIGS
jgi:hypothetical protein